jgi:hypothetical protein
LPELMAGGDVALGECTARAPAAVAAFPYFRALAVCPDERPA